MPSPPLILNARKSAFLKALLGLPGPGVGNFHNALAAGVQDSTLATFVNKMQVYETIDDSRLTSLVPPPSPMDAAEQDEARQAFAATICAFLASWDEDWKEIGASGQPAFQNSWTNYNASTDSTAAFYKAYDRVYLKGQIKSGGIPSTAFTLPEGYRPDKKMTFPVYSPVVTEAQPPGSLIIQSDGQVKPSTGLNTWISLDGISFRI